MRRICTLDTLVQDETKKRHPDHMDDEMGEALRLAVVATREKIDDAFSTRQKFNARLKSA